MANRKYKLNLAITEQYKNQEEQNKNTEAKKQ